MNYFPNNDIETLKIIKKYKKNINSSNVFLFFSRTLNLFSFFLF